MLSKITLKLCTDYSTDKIYNKSSLFHGALMDIITSEYADILHVQTLKPFSMYLKNIDNQIYWTINTLNDEAYEKIALPIMSDSMDCVYIRHNDIKYRIEEKTQVVSDYKELVDKFFFGSSDQNIKINFLTASSFKQNGNYLIYPDIRLLYQSLINKYDAFSDYGAVYSKDALDQLIQYSRIMDYSLKSCYFPLEGIKIPSFIGRIRIKINGPMQMRNLVNMLLHFGEYSGIGIKGALGMGAIKISEEEYR